MSILLEENGIITDCSLKTQHPDELLDFHLEPENVINKVVLQTELLKDILYELDPTSEVIEVTLAQLYEMIHFNVRRNNIYFLQS